MTPPSEMVERMGRAALCGWNNVDTDNAVMAAEWERMGPATREAWMRAMRRALEAMREPAPIMMDEAPSHAGLDVGAFTAAEVWRAMIDAALKDSP